VYCIGVFVGYCNACESGIGTGGYKDISADWCGHNLAYIMIKRLVSYNYSYSKRIENLAAT